MYKYILNLLLLLTLSFAAKASTITTDLSPDSTKTLSGSGSSWFSIDLNHDGIEDYNFSWYGGRFGTSLYCHGPSGNELAVISSGSTPLSVIDSNTLVSSSHAWTSAVSPGCSVTPGFTDAGDKFIGVKFMAGTSTYYGWIHISYTSSKTLTVMSYGYENVSGTSIYTPSSSSTALRPGADFTTTTTTTDMATTMTFTDISTNSPGSWTWTFTPATVTFMGGTTAASQNPQVQFGSAGKYTVKLKCSNTAGSDSITKTDYMTVTDKPAAAFSAGTVTTDTKTTVPFTDMSTNTPTSWLWTFTPATVIYIGGTSATSQNPQVQFGAPGKYTVKLKATNASGSDSMTKTDYITVIDTPVADFTSSTILTDTKTTVNFTDISTNTPSTWLWTFTPATVTYMGGTSATSQNPQVQFGSIGKYTVKLKVTNSAGSDSITKTNLITVTPPTSINTYKAEQIEVFPNPAHEMLTIKSPGGQGTILILDMQGKTEWTGTLNNKEMKLDISGLPKGQHMLRIMNEQGVLNQKLMIQ